MVKTETKVTHTPGALRAALLFDEQLVAAGLPSDYLSKRSRIEAMTTKIDQETAAPDMLEALEEIAERADSNAQEVDQNSDMHSTFIRIRDDAQAAIARAKGGAA